MTTLELIRNENIGTLKELTDISRGSARFFGDVAGKVQDKTLKTLFGEIAESRSRLVDVLAKTPAGSLKAQLANTASTHDAWRQHYMDLGKQVGDRSMGYLSDLEISERRLGTAFDNLASDGSMPESVKIAVVGYLPTMHRQRDSMHERVEALKIAA